MPEPKQKHRGLGGFLVVAISMAGCPGYLEEQAWLPDGGRPAYVAPSPTGGGAPVAPPAATGGSGVAPAPVGGSGTPAPVGTGGSGGSGGSGNTAGTGGSTPSGTGGSGPRASSTRDGGGPPDGTPAAPMIPLCATAPEITSKILMPKCARCHGGNTPAAGLNLALPGAKMRLLNVQARCAGKTLAVSEPAAGGHFFDKLAGAVPGCGMRMPLMGAALSGAEIQCLKDWIKPPAPPEPPPSSDVPLCATGPEITSKILTPKCGGCHGVREPAGGLDLVTAGAKMRLLNVPSRACNAKPLIVAEPAVAGHFFDKLAGAIPGCGNQMPFGGIAPLSAAEIKCLKDWIKPTP